MSWDVVFTRQARKDGKKLGASGLAEKAEKIVDVIKNNPYGIPPPYEKLVGSLNGSFSRRINRQHRIVYAIVERDHCVKVLRMFTHYE